MAFEYLLPSIHDFTVSESVWIFTAINLWFYCIKIFFQNIAVVSLFKASTPSAIKKKSGLIIEVASLQGDNLVVSFLNLTTSKIWLDKERWPLVSGVSYEGYCCIIFFISNVCSLDYTLNFITYQYPYHSLQ